ncbi:MAG: hypothetical protein KDK70_05545 [Myxococcales bacterium]|nr:hypothetical protein [Myxococcales bacterium]
MPRLPSTVVRLALVSALGGCSPSPGEVSGLSTGPEPTSGPASTSSSSAEPDSTGPAPGTTTAEPSSSTGSDGLDSTGPSDTTTAMGSSSSSSEESSTGEPSSVGCADGFRDALLDEATFPNVAACAGGFAVPGVDLDTPLCDRQAGNDGLLPDGMGCSIDDLCAAGWHLCTSRDQVAAAGLGNCDGVAWGGQFFATRQSGMGSNTCNASGTNDVFGCGDIGYTDISSCSPLNRSTGNLCVELSGPWQCDVDAYDEVSNLSKPGPTHGGARCCRDGIRAPPHRAPARPRGGAGERDRTRERARRLARRRESGRARPRGRHAPDRQRRGPPASAPGWSQGASRGPSRPSAAARTTVEPSRRAC